VPADLVESELFGHERGAFTGAIQSKLGKLDIASGGTVILDEIGNADITVQAKLLNVVEEKQFYRVGGTRPIEMNSRIVALSSVPLAKAVERGVFRQDLFFRLNLITVYVPPLRERRSEILAIAGKVLLQLDHKYNTNVSLLPECKTVLESYDFPGNVRELRNGLERAVLLSNDQRITLELLPPSWRRTTTTRATMPTLEEVEREYITKVLRETRGKKVKAAKILGISRKTLLEKRKRYGLD
jgi:transcriptional regulator with PAS, ATPase and Fis domain